MEGLHYFGFYCVNMVHIFCIKVANQRPVAQFLGSATGFPALIRFEYSLEEVPDLFSFIRKTIFIWNPIKEKFGLDVVISYNDFTSISIPM